MAKHHGAIDQPPRRVTSCRQQLDEVRDRVAVRNAFVSKGIAISRLNAAPSRALRNGIHFPKPRHPVNPRQ
jgi:hypothetical protein